MTDTIKTNPDTGVRYYDEPNSYRHGQSVDLFVPVRGDITTNPGGGRWHALYGLPYDGTEIKFYLKTAPKVREYDSQIFYEESTWGPVDYANPKPGGPSGTWEENLEVKRRSDEELFAQIESRRLQANAACYPASELPMLDALYGEARAQQAAGTASAIHLKILAQRNAVVTAGLANYERAEALKADVRAKRPFDLNAGWVDAVNP